MEAKDNGKIVPTNFIVGLLMHAFMSFMITSLFVSVNQLSLITCPYSEQYSLLDATMRS